MTWDLADYLNLQLQMTLLSEKPVDLKQKDSLSEIRRLDDELYKNMSSKFHLESALSRSLVSFQANKSREVYRWYKFKEGFSASLIEYVLGRYNISKGRILDPFAGSGTTLFAASAKGINSEGIELLSICQKIISAKKILESEFTNEDNSVLKKWLTDKPWKTSNSRMELLELRITRGAYPGETKEAIEKYLTVYKKENERVQTILQFALLCILESISFTRKDGQYLRWDYRSGRQAGKKQFDKGIILNFDEAICIKINEILSDIDDIGKQMNLFGNKQLRGTINLYNGSCLNVMPAFPEDIYDAIITSPPYCNRYDYTRTYALELALLGIGEKELLNLRQQMISCTVENRVKDLLQIKPQWAQALDTAEHQKLLQAILQYLDNQKSQGMLNNNGIPRMVRGYFYEMACVIAECSRVLKPNGILLMVNDNVRYAGASISVDMILSNMAEGLGFNVENILILPGEKGNSSQQMGEHGRVPLRKCVYVWRKSR
jgi:DNA modification methylase